MADYTINTDTQGETLLQRAVDDWIKANTVITNVVTKDAEGKEIVTPTPTIPTMTKLQFLQKLADDKLLETLNKMNAEEEGQLPAKWKGLPANKKKQIKDILEGK